METPNTSNNVVNTPVRPAETPKKPLRERILEAKDIKEELLYIPEWDASVLVKGLSGKQRARLLATTTAGGKPDIEKIYPEIVVMCVCDPETGQNVFTVADKDVINNKSGAALELIATKAMSLSGLTPESMEDLRKN